MPTEPLLPCPFCGAAAEQDSWDRMDDGILIGYVMEIHCSERDGKCAVGPSVSGDTETWAAIQDAWNTRVTE